MFKLRTSIKYIFSKSNGNRVSSFFIIIGIALCLVTMVLILSVMDSLQFSQIDRYRKIKSFDVTVVSNKLKKNDFRSVSNIDSIFEYYDFDVVYSNTEKGLSSAGILRAIDTYAYDDNPYILKDNFDGFLISKSIQNILSEDINSDITVTMLKKGKTEIFTPYKRMFEISGSYRSGLNDFNSVYCLVPIDFVYDLIPENKHTFGIIADEKNMEDIKEHILMLDPDAIVKDWKQNNSTLYSALKLEKSVITVFLLIVFCIVLINLKNSSDRLIISKLKDAGILRSLGMQMKDIVSIFLMYGFIITAIGLISGILLSYLIVNNLGIIFSLFGNYLYSSLLISIKISVSDLLINVLIISIVSFLFTFTSIRKYLKHDVMEVILNASY